VGDFFGGGIISVKVEIGLAGTLVGRYPNCPAHDIKSAMSLLHRTVLRNGAVHTAEDVEIGGIDCVIIV